MPIPETHDDHDHGVTVGGGTGSANNSGQFWTVDQVADYLSTGYWGAGPYAFNVAPGDSLTVNITGLNATGQTLARKALDAWTYATGIGFTEVSGAANISFDDNNPGAYASFSWTGSGTIVNASINISTSWVGSNSRTDSYGFQTYIHEIGHVLGLGHPGPYNGGGSYGQDNIYANDSWQMSIMSYFDQVENTAITASYAFAITPMIADIAAIHDVYGAPNVQAGDTVYGYGGNTGIYLDDWVNLSQPVAVTLMDSGGRDVLDLAGSGASQRVDLREEAISDVLGLIGNLIIAQGTVIEEVRSGSGADDVTGNGADNRFVLGSGADAARGMSGNDTINGGRGDDRLFGGDGDDTLYGDVDGDRLEGGDGVDALYGGAGFDALFGGFGDDLLDGGAQADNLFGGAGNDTLRGGDGLDRLSGEAGNDILDGGDGNDVLFGGTEADTLQGGAGEDRLFGGSGFDLLRGGANDDELRGELQADNLYGDGGNDTLFGDQGFDRLFGGVGDDALNGGADNDVLFGGGGNDMLDGGTGNDRLSGESGSDVFVFVDGFGADIITDFSIADLFEFIDFSGLSAIVDFVDLTMNHLTQSGADAVIDAGGGDVLTILGVSAPDFTADDFLF